MLVFTGSRNNVVLFAKDLLVFFGIDLPSITITRRGPSEACSVSIVIDTSLEDIVERLALSYCLQRTNI